MASTPVSRAHAQLHPHIVAVLAVGLLLASCAGEATRDAERVVRIDSAGREIVLSRGPAWEEGEGWTVSPEPVLTIGVAEGEDAYQLFRVADVMRLGDGRIVLANGGTREVRLYDADGRYVRTVGGPGEGPGEFGYPSGLMAGPGDGFTVIDRMDLERFDGEGSFVDGERFDRQRWSTLIGPLGPSEGGSPLPDGRVLAPIYGEGFSGPPQPGPPFRPDITLVVVDLATPAVDTLTRIGGIRQQYIDVGGARAQPIVAPFAPSGRWHVGRGGGVVAYDGEVPEVERLFPDGLHRVLRWEAEPEPITSQEIETWKERQRGASWAQDQLPQLERGWAAMDMPTEKAHVTDARPATDGATWVRLSPQAHEADAPGHWRIFGPDGDWLGDVELPGRLVVQEIGDGYVLGVHRDPETEIEVVQLYAVEKRGG